METNKDTSNLTQHQKLDVIIKAQRLADEVASGRLESQSALNQKLSDTLAEIGKQQENLVENQIEVFEAVLDQGQAIERIEKSLQQQSQRITWVGWLVRPMVILLFGLALMTAFQSEGCGCKHRPWPNPIPKPSLVDDKIVVSSQVEMNVILSALRIVEKEQQLNPDRDLYDAIEALKHLFGDGKDGVKQNVQDKIIVEFTGGRNLNDSIEYVRSKLTVR